MPRPTIANAAAELLAEHRELTAEELGAVIVERKLTRSADPARAISGALGLDPRFHRLPDRRWALRETLLSGACLTHRLTEEEAATGTLALDTDLAPLRAIAFAGLHTPDGDAIELVWNEPRRPPPALTGPPGWLAPHQAGELIAIRLDGRVLRVEPGPPPQSESRLTARRIVEAARARLEKMHPYLTSDPMEPIHTFVLDLLAGEPGILEQPLPPLGELFERGGLEVHLGYLGLPGTDWAEFDELFAVDGDGTDPDDEEDVDAKVMAAFDLNPAELDAVRIILGAQEITARRGPITDAESLADFARLLARPRIAQVIATAAWDDPAIEAFVASIAEAAGGREAAGARYVLGACAEARRDVLRAEQLYQAAVEADPEYRPALIELARYESDRGRYATALAHLRAADISADDPERAWLEAQASPAVAKVGRNDPCPCGSGRKYKVCHLDGPPVFVDVDPVRAIQYKLDNWLAQPDMQGRLDALMAESVGDAETDAEDEDEPELDRERESVMAVARDIVLFDEGGLADFLSVRGPLLPPGEVGLAGSWLDTRRSLYEVRGVRPGAGITLEDLRDGGMIDVSDRSLSRQVQLLDLLCLRLVPDGRGGLTVMTAVMAPRPERRFVLDVLETNDGPALLDWIANGPPPPRLVNAEGEPLLLVTASYRVPDPDGTAAALARKLEDDGDGRFLELIEVRGERWIRGTITLEADRATVVANSAKRASRLERTLLRAAPGAKRISREERALDPDLARAEEGPTTQPPVDPAASPELARVLDEHIRAAEERWIDEAIPALGGMTPREALGDPAARRELEALLDDMTWLHRRAAGQGRMDAGRIRTLLGMVPSRQ